MSHVTQLLQAMDAGDPKASVQLLPLADEELRIGRAIFARGLDPDPPPVP